MDQGKGLDKEIFGAHRRLGIVYVATSQSENISKYIEHWVESSDVYCLSGRTKLYSIRGFSELALKKIKNKPQIVK